MTIKYLGAGIIEFEADGKTIGAGRFSESPVYRRFMGEIPLTIEFSDNSRLVFRFGLDGQRFTSKPEFYLGRDGKKESFLQPADYKLKQDLLKEGYDVKQSGPEAKSDFGKRIGESFSGFPLERIVFLQDPSKNFDQVILTNGKGELRILNEHGFLIAIEEIPSDEEQQKTIYEVGEKGSHYREPNLMVCASLAQRPEKGSPLESVGSSLDMNPSIPLELVSESDLMQEVSNRGNVIHLGCRIK